MILAKSASVERRTSPPKLYYFNFSSPTFLYEYCTSRSLLAGLSILKRKLTNAVNPCLRRSLLFTVFFDTGWFSIWCSIYVLQKFTRSWSGCRGKDRFGQQPIQKNCASHKEIADLRDRKIGSLVSVSHRSVHRLRGESGGLEQWQMPWVPRHTTTARPNRLDQVSTYTYAAARQRDLLRFRYDE